jgi:hypothetical protein
MDHVGQKIGSELFGGGIYSKDLGVEVAPPCTEGIPQDKAVLYHTQRFYCLDFGMTRQDSSSSSFETIQVPKSNDSKRDLRRVRDSLIKAERTPIFQDGPRALSADQRKYLCSIL